MAANSSRSIASISLPFTPIALSLATVLFACASTTDVGPAPAAPQKIAPPPPPDTPEKPKLLVTDPCLVYPTQFASLNGPGSRNAQRAQAELQRGLELAQTGNHFAAIEAFDKALSADPYHGLTHLAAAESHLFTDNDSSKMRSHLTTAVLLLPENPRAHSRLADYLAEIGEADAALTHWRCALALKAGFHEARLNMARYLVTLDRSVEAETELRSIEGGLTDPIILALLGDALAAQGKLLDAAQSIEEAAKRSGPSASLLRKAGDLYDAAKSRLSARRVRAQADRIDPPPRERRMRPLKQRGPRAAK